MSTVLSTTEGRTPNASAFPPSQPSKPPRVLACVLCQQRKVKCDRKHPCANCIKVQAQCIPTTKVSHQRKRRFPERALLERIRKYEELLRQNNINFEPLHGNSVSKKELPSLESSYDSYDEQPRTSRPDRPTPSITGSSEKEYEANNIWRAMSQTEEFRDPETYSDSSADDIREVIFQKAYEESCENTDHFLFGLRQTAVDISTLHPEPVQIFRLWQLYLDNINPLLKVSHTFSLQGRIIEAAGNVSNINPTLEALMFSIYCMSILSLSVDDCQDLFGSSKADLLTRYQFGCQQALLNCGFLRCDNRDCLTALFLYLVSIRRSTIPQSLSSMLGIAIRIAQHMGIHSERGLAKCTAHEAEMRRRVWWSLKLFDSRIGEMAEGFKTTRLTSTWDCKIPLNVNDTDFPPEMKEPPQAQGEITDAIFAVVRSELADFIRHTVFNSGEGVQRGAIPEGSELVSLEKTIQDKYLKFLDPENPLHFMTIWTTRGYIAKSRLAEHNFRYSGSSLHLADGQRDAALSYALGMLECDTKITASPLTKGFLWLSRSYFPFPAYMHITQYLKWRPVSDKSERAWEVMSDNYQAHFGFLVDWEDSPFFKIFANVVLQAWEAREAISKDTGESVVIPRIVLSIRHKLAQLASNARDSETAKPFGATERSLSDFFRSLPMDFDSHNLNYGMGGQDGYGVYPDMLGMAPLYNDINQLNWSAMDWDLVNAPIGESAGLPF